MRRTSVNLEKRDEQRFVASIGTRQKKLQGDPILPVRRTPPPSRFAILLGTCLQLPLTIAGLLHTSHATLTLPAAGTRRRVTAHEQSRERSGTLPAQIPARQQGRTHPTNESRRCVASRRESSLCRLATRVVVVSPRDESRRCVASRRESSLCRLATRVVVVSPRDESRRCVASRRESSLCRLATRVVVVSPRDESRRCVASRRESSLCRLATRV